MNMTYKGFSKGISTIGFIMGHLRIPWFLSFGCLLGLIRDGGLLKDKDGNIKTHEDIDISMMFDKMDEKRILGSFKKFKYECTQIVRNDYDASRKPLYMHFKHPEAPELCLFAWVKAFDGKLYHTYDVNREKKEILSEYVFKGIYPDYLDPIIKQKFIVGGEKLDIPIPQRYGTVLDFWYPDWLKCRGGESETDHTFKMKSCKKLY